MDTGWSLAIGAFYTQIFDSFLQQELNNNLESIAAEEGYDYILNSTDGSGVSIVLRGPKEHNLNERLFAKLGIAFPRND